MKRLLIVIFSVFYFTQFFAQTTTIDPKKYINEKTGEIEFKEVIEVKGTQDELYNRCVYWLNDFYKDPTRITQVRDRKTGKIVGRHYFRIYKTNKQTNEKERFAKVYYTFTIRFKDGKYKWQLDKLELVSKTPQKLYDWFNTNNPEYKEEWRDYLQQILVFVDKWSSSLKQKMMPQAADKEEDW